MKRLFVALPVPSGFISQLRELPYKGLEGKWNHKDDLHITIRFLGEVEENQIIDITDALNKVRRPQFSIEVSGLNVFDNKRQSILYANIASTKKLTTLCAEITDVLTPLGFDFGTRPYKPHITLIRLKNPHGIDKYINQHGKKINSSWRATGFKLMESSSADEKGCHYKTLADYGLG